MTRLDRAGLIAVFVLCLSGVAAGQSPSVAAVDTTTLAWAKRLLAATHAQDALLAGFDTAFAAQRQRAGLPGPAIYFDSLAARGRREAPQLVDSIAVAWAGQLSLADLQDLVRFYESALGQRYASAGLRVDSQTQSLVQRWGMRLAMDVMRDLIDKGLITASDLPQ